MGKNDPTRNKAGQQQNRPQAQPQGQERIGQTRERAQGMADDPMRQQGKPQHREPGHGQPSKPESMPKGDRERRRSPEEIDERRDRS
ncbi:MULTISPECIES: hypothetical protein [unclassified Streptomyces]|uniref:hypothetical protein n=1 Tax=unclassified Streptomyces TaxID=2593676 RepID=UPI000366D04B|nr:MULTISPECIES: hypothetical protein [unclassified Streptomyces]MYX37417.1 hypothetical protein [Streptomyces sp. SID8377]